MTFTDPADARPTGVPDGDPLRAAEALLGTLRPRLNMTAKPLGLLMSPGHDGPMSAAAQVASALALVDIAESLRMIAGRETDKT